MSGATQLGIALRAHAEQVMDMRDQLDDSDSAGYHQKARVLGDAHTLLRVLANVADGKPFLWAMGAPGDWGYQTQLGKALIVALKNQDAAAPDMQDAYVGAREDLAIWKKRALEAEELNRRLMAEIQGPTHMGEPELPAMGALTFDDAFAEAVPTPSEPDAMCRGERS